MTLLIRTLIWKDFLIRKNHYIATAFEVFLPILLFLLINSSLSEEEKTIDRDTISFLAFKRKECVPRHSHYGSIVYEPSTPITKRLMEMAACYAGYHKTNVKAGSLVNNTYFSIGVKFNNAESSTDKQLTTLNYTLFPTSKALMNVGNLWRHSGTSIPKFSIPTVFTLVELQRAIDASYLDLNNVSTPTFVLENTDVYDRLPGRFSLAVFITLIMAFSLLVPTIVGRIVQEKHSGAKELMLMMGVDRWQLWVAKFVDVLIFLIPTVFGIVLFLSVPLGRQRRPIEISPVLLASVLLYGLIGVIVFLFFMSCFFERPAVALFVTECFWFSSFGAHYLVSAFFELPLFVKHLMCLLPHVSLMQGVNILLKFDSYGKPVKLTERLSGREDALTLLSILLMIAFDIVLYAVLTWYLDQVKPGKYGVPLPYNFCFKKSYWIPEKVNQSQCADLNNISKTNIEDDSRRQKVGISVQNVTKVYKSADKGTITAVDNVSLNFYCHEISGLVGQNGAGKSTLFSMITGLSYPASGTIIVNGYDVGVNIREARRSLGLCPQQDMLFDDLTTAEILMFFGVVKGLNMKEARKEAFELIVKLELQTVRNTQASKLSGGQKRKVSLAIALIGGSQILVLDEPTSGMDPEIRTEIREILRGLRSERTILLTTHFMEEADALCDRIAMMDSGKIKCYGTPMFLKSKYGDGFVLSAVANDKRTLIWLHETVSELVPNAKPQFQNNLTVCFKLPGSEVMEFRELFENLDWAKRADRLQSYSFGFSTLENIFLRLRSDHKENEEFDVVDSSAYKSLENCHAAAVKPSRFIPKYNQFWALMYKKRVFFQRSFKSYLLYSILPLALVMLFDQLSSAKGFQSTNSSNVKSLTYSLDLYPSSLGIYSTPENSNSEGKLFEKMFESSGGGTAMKVNFTEDGIENIFEDDFYTYAKKLILGVHFSPDNFQIYHNQDAVHMVPISLNFFHNYLLKYWHRNESITTSIDVSYANKEFFKFLPDGSNKCRVNSLPDFGGAQTMFYSLGPLKEQIFGAKKIQLMMTSVPLYWASNLVFDSFTYLLYQVVLFLGVGALHMDKALLVPPVEIFFGFLHWGVGLILIQYILSNLVNSMGSAFSMNMILYVFFTFVVHGFTIFEGPLTFLRYLHPSWVLKSGIDDYCSGKENYFVYYLFGYDCAAFALLIFGEYKLVNRMAIKLLNRFIDIKHSIKTQKDEGVKTEEDTVDTLIKKKNLSDCGLVAQNIRRWYLKNFKPFHAIRGISFAVNRGECFGLLGVNGAGKTTTFRILTGEIPASHGRIYALSQELDTFNRPGYTFSIGYCPQSGGLIPDFKGKELLKFYARLRGIQRSRITEEVQKWLHKMNILEYANEKCGTYSGGNQRKLVMAIALIGDSPLIFLDEPTSGVDPLSRRSIWKVIRDAQREGKSVVLTSHSMDECETLCTRLAIMVKGRFRCIGETTTLKNKFGNSYFIHLMLSSKSTAEQVKKLKTTFHEIFEKEGCQLVSENVALLEYRIRDSLSLRMVLEDLETLKERCSIFKSFMISTPTLEHIFINFAKNSKSESSKKVE